MAKCLDSKSTKFEVDPKKHPKIGAFYFIETLKSAKNIHPKEPIWPNYAQNKNKHLPTRRLVKM